MIETEKTQSRKVYNFYEKILYLISITLSFCIGVMISAADRIINDVGKGNLLLHLIPSLIILVIISYKLLFSDKKMKGGKNEFNRKNK